MEGEKLCIGRHLDFEIVVKFLMLHRWKTKRPGSILWAAGQDMLRIVYIALIERQWLSLKRQIKQERPLRLHSKEVTSCLNSNDHLFAYQA